MYPTSKDEIEIFNKIEQVNDRVKQLEDENKYHETIYEDILCLSNEIKKLKKEIQTLHVKNSNDEDKYLPYQVTNLIINNEDTKTIKPIDEVSINKEKNTLILHEYFSRDDEIIELPLYEVEYHIPREVYKKYTQLKYTKE